MSILQKYWDRQNFDSPPCWGKIMTSKRIATHYVHHFILKKYWDSIWLTAMLVEGLEVWELWELGLLRFHLQWRIWVFQWENLCESIWVFLYFCISVFLWEMGLLRFHLQWRIWVFLLEGGGKFTIPHFSNYLFYCCHMWQGSLSVQHFLIKTSHHPLSSPPQASMFREKHFEWLGFNKDFLPPPEKWT